jgi:hypothetical protein
VFLQREVVSPKRTLNEGKLAPMSWSRRAALAVLSLTLPPNTQVAAEEPLPRGVAHLDGPYAATWTKKSAHIAASRVRLHATGARTHANWVLFRLPFDSTQRDRIRRVRIHATSTVDTNVAALLLGSVCVPFPTSGDVSHWPLFSVGGIWPMLPFRLHGQPATDDPTIVAINAPTRVANYVACGGDERLEDPDRWAIDVTWEER